MKANEVKGRRDGWTSLIAAVTFVLAYFGARLVLKLPEAGAALKVAAAVVPAMAFLWFAWSFVHLMRKLDELQRRIQLEALAIAYPLAIAIVMMISLFQKAGYLEWEPMWSYLPITYYLGLFIAQRRYQ